MSFLTNAVGSLVGGAASIWSANKANSAQAEMMASAQAFNKEVMQNKHQWEVADLKAAGLNPLLASTAPTGTLSSPSGGTAAKADIAQSAAALGSLAIQNKQAEAALTNAKTSQFLAESQSQKNIADAGLSESQTNLNTSVVSDKLRAETDNLIASTSNAKLQGSLLKIQNEYQRVFNDLDVAYRKLGISKVTQDIVNSQLLANAQSYMYKAQGDAAYSNAASNRLMANSSFINATSQAHRNAVLNDLTETEKQRLNEDIKKLKFDNRFINVTTSGPASQALYYISDAVGKTFGNMLPILKGFK